VMENQPKEKISIFHDERYGLVGLRGPRPLSKLPSHSRVDIKRVLKGCKLDEVRAFRSFACQHGVLSVDAAQSVGNIHRLSKQEMNVRWIEKRL
jgi:hypothetical protein